MLSAKNVNFISTFYEWCNNFDLFDKNAIKFFIRENMFVLCGDGTGGGRKG